MANYFQGAFKEGRNLTEESVRFAKTLFRDELVFKVLQVIARQRSILLVGPLGVGKTRVLHELANQVRRSGRCKIYEFSVSQLLTGTKYLGEWESKVTQILDAAERSDSVLYFSDIWNLPTAAKSTNREGSAWDLIRPRIEQRKLQLIGEVTPEQLVALSTVKGFSTLFEGLQVSPLNTKQIIEILSIEAKRIKLDADELTITRVQELCQQFLGEAEGPGPALELLSQIRDYQSQKHENNETETVSPKFVEKVFSIYSGLPPIVVSPSVTKPVKEVTEWFEQRVIGQKNAISAVVETIALYKAGLHDPDRPIGSFLFVGPTGVGKTELAKALAQFLFGTENRLLRFDLSEYKDYHAFQLLIGNPDHPMQPARLVDPVRAKPFQVILLDEIEKAHANVLDLLLQLLDEGRLTPASGKSVNFRNTIIIATSNVGAKEQAKSSVGFVSEGSDAGSARMRQALEVAFRPEFLNRFQYVAYFHPLTKEHVKKIARMELAKILNRQGIAGRQISVDITPPVLDLIVKHGYDQSYGARALRRMVQRHVTMPIATLLLEKSIEDGSILRLITNADAVRVDVIDTPKTRLQKKQARPIKSKLGAMSSRTDIISLLAKLKQARLVMTQQVAILTSNSTQNDSEHLLLSTTNPEDLARFIRQREIVQSRGQRLDKLLQRESELEDWLKSTVTREERQRLVDAICAYDVEIDSARREMLLMPKNSFADAIVEITALGTSNKHAIELFSIYNRWAKKRGYSVDMIYEPMTETEPVSAAIIGQYAFGYLHLEAGHHRFREQQFNHVVRVNVFPWLDQVENVSFVEQRALKKNGLLGGRIRSRIQVAERNLIIQNERTLIANRTLAASITPAYREDTRIDELVVRRYDRIPFLLRDHLTGISTGRPDAIESDGFHELLCQRIDATYDQE